MTIGEAREALWIALREGFFPASGIDAETGRRVQIPALEWQELVPIQGKGEVTKYGWGRLGTGYHDVLVPSVALLGFWRKPVENVVRLPPTMALDGFGYMPLYCVAQWIATEGGTREFDPADLAVWKPAFDKLIDDLWSLSGGGL